MTEMTTKEMPAWAPGRCTMGHRSQTPCMREAVAPIPRHRSSERALCAFHLALEPMWEEVNALGFSEEIARDTLERAREVYAWPLVDLLEHAAAEYARRLEALEENLRAIEAAAGRTGGGA